MSWVQMSIGGLMAWNQIQQGRSADDAAKSRGRVLEFEAQREQQDALDTAEIIRRAGRRQIGETTAAYAGAGVQVGQGSALEVETQVARDVEHDAFAAILSGDRRALSLRTDAAVVRGEGRAARTAGYVNAAGTLLGAYGNASQGWKTKQYTYNDDASGMLYSRSGEDIRGRR